MAAEISRGGATMVVLSELESFCMERKKKRKALRLLSVTEWLWQRFYQTLWCTVAQHGEVSPLKPLEGLCAVVSTGSLRD